ncbi:hypothetical protein [Mesorhizobium sp. M0633]|uniref:hypothetical protein n=1 Tax=Mesorhizobium sp. M0633 TaxID=2956977 RepID=UPI003337D1CA
MTIAILFSAGRAIVQGSRIELAQADVSTKARGPFGCFLGRPILSVSEHIGGLKNFVNSGDRCVIQAQARLSLHRRWKLVEGISVREAGWTVPRIATGRQGEFELLFKKAIGESESCRIAGRMRYSRSGHLRVGRFLELDQKQVSRHIPTRLPISSGPFHG